MRKLMVVAVLLSTLSGCGLSPAGQGMSPQNANLNALNRKANALVPFAEATLKGIDKNGDRTITFAEYMSTAKTGGDDLGGIGTLLYMTTWGSLHALSRQTHFALPDDADPKAILGAMQGQSFAIKDFTSALTSDFFVNSLKTVLGSLFSEQDKNKNGFLEPNELSTDDWNEVAPFDADKDKRISTTEYIDASLSTISNDKTTPAAVRLGQIAMLVTVKQ